MGSVLRVGVGIQGWIRYTGLGLVDRVGVGIQGWGRYTGLGSVNRVGVGLQGWGRFTGLGSVYRVFAQWYLPFDQSESFQMLLERCDVSGQVIFFLVRPRSPENRFSDGVGRKVRISANI